MKRKLMVTGIVVGAMMLALGTVAVAQGRGDRARHGKMGRVHHRAGQMMERLNLTTEQMGKVVELRKEMVGKALPIGVKLREVGEQARTAWKSGTPDEGRIVALHREMRSLRGQLDELRISFRFDVLELLTPTQRAALSRRGEARPDRGFRGEHGRDRGDRIRQSAL
jgi:Spy/CpxP family protein refolding chaperone